MKPLLAALLATVIGALLAAPALAAQPDCLATAIEMKLAGAARGSFVKKCVRERCETGAVEKKLAGAAKNSFNARCVADGLQPYCADQAASKKLAGAARNSFMKKCQAGN